MNRFQHPLKENIKAKNRLNLIPVNFVSKWSNCILKKGTAQSF